MSWIHTLYQTYQQCAATTMAVDAKTPLEPICHTSQLAQIEVSIDGNGNFQGAQDIKKGQGVTLVPCTEASVGRSGSKPINHPLCDKLQYLAGDFLQYGGEVTSGFASKPTGPHDSYLALLEKWADSSFTHPKVKAILAYVKRNTLVADLVTAKVLPTGVVKGVPQLLKTWSGDKATQPDIFSVMANGTAPEEAFVRWRVNIPGDLYPETWRDQSLIDAWVGFYLAEIEYKGLCLVTGNMTTLAKQHGAKIRHAADKAKLISSNDTTGFTFRGRFSTAEQACAVGFEVTQKAHNALRWLIRRQAFRNGDQAVVAWDMGGKTIPQPLWDTHALYGDDDDDESADEGKIAANNSAAKNKPVIAPIVGDIGQAFSLNLAKCLAGYKSEIGPLNQIAILALDSATTGRLAIIYYREQTFSEYIERIGQWHERHAWPQNYGKVFGKKKSFIGAPAPQDIAEVCYGKRLDEKLRKATIERLLACIMEGRRIPDDLMHSAVRRASNRLGQDYFEWEKSLGIACGLFKGYHFKENYKMALEPDRISRDYLYGRMLAIADNIEREVLRNAGETRETNAERLMQRFAAQPYKTWLVIATQLRHYITKARAIPDGFLATREKLLDEIASIFAPDLFMNNKPLSGEFLLGFHCQRHELANKADENA